MSRTNTSLDFSKKAEPINSIPPLAYESSNHELFTHLVITEKEESMNTNQSQNHNTSIPHPLAELLLDILTRASATYSDNH